MILPIPNLPDNIVGFKATGEINREDFTMTVMPRVQKLVADKNELNYLFVVDTPLRNFTVGSWAADALMGVRHLLKWNRAAIVSDEENIRHFTNLFSKFMPGEFRGFAPVQLKEAIDWVSGNEQAGG